VDFLLGKDVSQSVLESIMNFDPYLDEAIKLVIDNDEKIDDIEDDWDHYQDED